MSRNLTALKFAASNAADRVTLDARASIRNLDAFTWQAWVKPGNNGTILQRAYMEHQGGTGAGKALFRFAVTPVNGLLRFELSPKDGAIDTNYSFPFDWGDRWHHVAFMCSVTQEDYEILLDGFKVAEGALIGVASETTTNTDGTSTTRKIGIPDTPPDAITVGGTRLSSTSEWRWWDGKIDEIQIWKTKRNEGDVRTTMYEEAVVSGPDASADILYNWRFNEGTGEGTGALTTGDSDNPGWTGSLSSARLWTVDRPFLGDGVQDENAPTVPSFLGISEVRSDRFTASWNASTDNVFVQRYELEVSESTDFSASRIMQAGRNLSVVVGALLPATNYYVRVRAFDAADNASGYRTTSASPSVRTQATGDLYPPFPPRLNAAQNVGFSSFTLSWSATTDDPRNPSGVAGYRLDVSPESDFRSYLDRYQNRDVGNVTSVLVTGAESNSSFYCRLRAYDAAGNVSATGDTVVVVTLPLPDTKAPNTVNPVPASSVGSTSFVANWEPSFDNVGVVGYRLDVSPYQDFRSYMPNYQNRNVGDVLAHSVTGLLPSRTYWYRVRAVDAAGNVSPNGVPVSVATEPNSLIETGIRVVSFEPTDDAYADTATATTGYGGANQLRVSASQTSFLRFDLSSVVGTVEAAALRLWVEVAGGPIEIQRTAADFSEETLRGNNQPSVSGSTVIFTPLAVGWVEVDIGSLIGRPSVYAFRLRRPTGGTNAVFSSKEGTNRPTLTTEINPNDATEPRSFRLSSGSGGRKNYATNPSFEIGMAGWVGGYGAVVSRVTDWAAHGAASARVVNNGSSAAQGLHSQQFALLVRQGEDWTVSFNAKVDSGSHEFGILLRERDQAGTLLLDGQKRVMIGTDGSKRYSLTHRVFSPDCRYLSAEIFVVGTKTLNWNIDAILFERTNQTRSYFDGSFPSAQWLGSAHASASVMGETTLLVDSTYLGDYDNDNSAYLEFRRKGTSDWVRLPAALQPTPDRNARRVQGIIGPTIPNANLIENGSFEYGNGRWVFNNAPAGVNAEWEWVADGKAMHGTRAMRLTVRQNTLATMTIDAYANALRTDVTPGQSYTLSTRYRTTSNELIPCVVLRYFDASGNIVSTTFSSERESETLIGGVGYRRVTAAVPSNATQLRAYLLALATKANVTGTVHFDAVQLEATPFSTPYVDGGDEDGLWRGAEGASITDRVLVPSREYEGRITYVDPEGVAGVNPMSGSVTTAEAPDLALTTGVLEAVLGNNTIDVVASYQGDDDGSANATVRWRRADLTVWTTVPSENDRDDKVVRAKIRNLSPGTAYEVEVRFFDAPYLFGRNPLVETFVTDTKGALAAGGERITFGGFVLHSDTASAWCFVHEGDGPLGLPERRLVIEENTREDGGREISRYWGERKIRLQGAITSTDRKDLEAKRRMLVNAVSRGQQRLVYDTLSDSRRYFVATLDSLSIPEVGGRPTHLEWDAVFRCADPFAYDFNESMDRFTVVNNQVVKVVNDGDLPVAPRIILSTTNTVTPVKVQIYNRTSGDRIAPASTFLSSDTVTIDNHNQGVFKNGVTTDFDGGFIRLNPGVNEIQVVVLPSSGTGGESRVTLDLRRRHKYL